MRQTIYLLTALLFLFSSCRLSDLSSEEAKEDTTAKAKGILEAAAVAHGADKWADIKTYEVIFKDEFYGAIGKMASPFKGNPITARLQYVPKQADSKATFQHPDMKEQIWGIQEGKTYCMDLGGEAKFKEDPDIRFWLPTYQYFIEFPGRITEANVFRWVGTEQMNGKTYDKVFVSWNQVAPQKDIDQYIVWVDQESKLIGKLAYTIREANGWIQGHAMFEGLKDFGGIIVPTEMPVGSNLLKEGKLLHKMSIVELKFDSFN